MRRKSDKASVRKWIKARIKYSAIFEVAKMLEKEGIEYSMMYDKTFEGFRIYIDEKGYGISCIEHNWSYGNVCDRVEVLTKAGCKGWLRPREAMQEIVNAIRL